MTVRANKAIGLELAAGGTRWLSDPIRLPKSPGRRRTSVRPPAPADRVAEAAERGKLLIVGDVPVNGHHVAEELAGAWVAAHRLLHDVDPVEARAEWTAIVSAARRVLAEYFKGDFEAALDMVRWSLANRHDRKDGRRLTWRSVFHAGNVTDFKVSKAAR